MLILFWSLRAESLRRKWAHPVLKMHLSLCSALIILVQQEGSIPWKSNPPGIQQKSKCSQSSNPAEKQWKSKSSRNYNVTQQKWAETKQKIQNQVVITSLEMLSSHLLWRPVTFNHLMLSYTPLSLWPLNPLITFLLLCVVF